jgi:NAD(P)H-hydrate epimerase
VVVIAGAGNNGGDGYGLACQLKQLGWPVSVWCIAAREKINGDARIFFEKAVSLQVPVEWKEQAADWEGGEWGVLPGTWFVDAILGTGSREAPRGTAAAAVSFLRGVQQDHRIWSVDLPSGLNPDTGEPFEPESCVIADATLSLGGPKRGFLTDSSGKWTGSVSVLEIGLDLEEESDDWQILTDREIRSALPGTQVDDHKGSRGHALFIGGSPGMSGSISLAAVSALRSGAGLSSVLAPFTTAPGIDAGHKEVMVIPGKQGKFMTLSPQDIKFDPFGVVCIGPGLRVNPETIDVVRRVVQECPHPLVIDADGLNALAQIGIRVGDFRRPVFLTPHPGEMARLLEKRTADVQENRECAVTEAAKYSHAHVVLKGPHSRIVSQKGVCWVNTSGNAALATGGTGDVLAGILTGLIARGTPVEMALPVSVALHGRAGELAAIRKGVSSVLAGDVLEALSAVFHHAEGR